MSDVVIVGSGPAGSRTGELISKAGYDVTILEEHPEAGTPMQCTGFVSEKIGEIPKEIIYNKVTRARFCSDGEFFEIKSKQPFFVMDRKAYDKFRASEAERAGVKFKLSTRFLDYKNGEIETSNGSLRTKLLIGADGPNSTVARNVGIERPKNRLFAMQLNATGQFDPDVAELWFGTNTAPGQFAWVVPENEEVARIGIMTDVNPNEYFQNFLKKRAGEKFKSTHHLGDVIRYGLIKNSVANNVMLVGDAACQVKPFSAGGLIYNKIGAEFCSEAAIKSLEANNFSEEFFTENYDKKWKKRLGLGIKRGMMMRRIFQRFRDNKMFFKSIRSLRLTSLATFLDADFLGKD